MIMKSVTSIYFSPTGTTKNIIDSIINGMGIIKDTSINLTDYKVRSTAAPIINGDIVIIGVPVYEERVPKMVYNFLNSLNGNKKPLILVAVYGNFGYGTALNELNSIGKNRGFNVVAAGAFIGEHSFSTKEVPVQEGRPNYEDLNMAKDFGESIIKKLSRIDPLNNNVLEIPKGKLQLMAKILPSNRGAKVFTKTPLADMNTCNFCGVCAKLCPMNAINKDTLEITENECIRCFSCVKRCPAKARKIIYRKKFIVSKFLASKNKISKTPQIFL